MLGGGVKAGATRQGNRTIITLEDAEPEVLLDVMKVLVSSKARVRYETH